MTSISFQGISHIMPTNMVLFFIILKNETTAGLILKVVKQYIGDTKCNTGTPYYGQGGDTPQSRKFSS